VAGSPQRERKNETNKKHQGALVAAICAGRTVAGQCHHRSYKRAGLYNWLVPEPFMGRADCANEIIKATIAIILSLATSETWTRGRFCRGAPISR